MRDAPQDTTVAVGGRAEQAAAEYLARLGYDVVERNFRRPYCEIDIVARRGGAIFFVEVKYRATDAYGAGLDYVSGKKLMHMQRAAETWVSHNRWDGEYTLSAIEVTGLAFEIGDFVESIY